MRDVIAPLESCDSPNQGLIRTRRALDAEKRASSRCRRACSSRDGLRRISRETITNLSCPIDADSKTHTLRCLAKCTWPRHIFRAIVAGSTSECAFSNRRQSDRRDSLLFSRLILRETRLWMSRRADTCCWLVSQRPGPRRVRINP